jgi:hypothetical protein
MKITLSRQDPRSEMRSYGPGELNCTRYAVVEGRIFRVMMIAHYWEVEELHTETSMVDYDTPVSVICRTLADARESIANHIEAWPTESREAHYQRTRAWAKSLYTETVGG